MTEDLSGANFQSEIHSTADFEGKSRKRGREILEGVALRKDVPDEAAESEVPNETNGRAKKNRVYDSAEEPEIKRSSRMTSRSPPGSPPPEPKMVRQISQGVEDLTWKSSEKSGSADKISNSGDDNGEERGMLSLSQSDSGPESKPEVENIDKSLKRKFEERGTSQGPVEGIDPKMPSETLKRARDDANDDPNPRQTKRPTPPPDESDPAVTSKLSDRKENGTMVNQELPFSENKKATTTNGFMVYASSSSPFSSVKGPNLFSRSKSPDTGVLASELTPTKRTGFEAFAYEASPFSTAASSKSPLFGSSSKWSSTKPASHRSSTTVDAFSAYASGGAQGFVPLPKRARAGSPSGSSTPLDANSTIGIPDTDGGGEEADCSHTTFGERLRAGKDVEGTSGDDDFQPKVILKEQEVMTGEEEEETVYQVRGKLFTLADGNTWKEKGTGLLKLNVRAVDGAGARLVMRKEAVYTVILNVTLFRGMRCELAQDPRYLRFSVIENGLTTHYNLKLANTKVAGELKEEILANLPA